MKVPLKLAALVGRRPLSTVSDVPLIRTRGIPTQVTDFDRSFQKLSEKEQLQLEADYEPLNKQDWRLLTLDQKRARTSTPHLSSLHDIVWGAEDPRPKRVEKDRGRSCGPDHPRLLALLDRPSIR